MEKDSQPTHRHTSMRLPIEDYEAMVEVTRIIAKKRLAGPRSVSEFAVYAIEDTLERYRSDPALAAAFKGARPEADAYVPEEPSRGRGGYSRRG